MRRVESFACKSKMKGATKMFSMGIGTLPYHAATGEERLSAISCAQSEMVSPSALRSDLLEKSKLCGKHL